MLGGMTFEGAVRQAMETSGCWSEAAYEAILQLRRVSREICQERLHPGVLPMLEALMARGVRIGLVSNCQSEEVDAIRASVLYPYFDACVMSFEAGVMKPDPAIFRRCTGALGVSPAECLYVGDGGSHELEAARALGMRALQAAWYLVEGDMQPCARMPEFPHAESPDDVIAALT